LRKDYISFLFLIVAVVLVPAGPRAQWKTHWTYEGPTGAEHWGDLDPEYAACKVGKEQSPIDIRNAEKAELPSLLFEYRSGPLRIINNGYTAVRVNYAPGNGIRIDALPAGCHRGYDRPEGGYLPCSSRLNR